MDLVKCWGFCFGHVNLFYIKLDLWLNICRYVGSLLYWKIIIIWDLTNQINDRVYFACLKQFSHCIQKTCWRNMYWSESIPIISMFKKCRKISGCWIVISQVILKHFWTFSSEKSDLVFRFLIPRSHRLWCGFQTISEIFNHFWSKETKLPAKSDIQPGFQRPAFNLAFKSISDYFGPINFCRISAKLEIWPQMVLSM